MLSARDRQRNYLMQRGISHDLAFAPPAEDWRLTGRQRRRIRHKQAQDGGKSAALRTARLARTARRVAWRRYIQGRS